MSNSSDLYTPIVQGKELRFAPSRDSQQAANMWKIWATGGEVYATGRAAGNVTRISIHATGQIHIHYGGRDVQHLVGPVPLGEGRWSHALEMRFLIGPDAHRPRAEKLKKKTRAYLVAVPTGSMLVVNLLLSQQPPSGMNPLPAGFIGQVVWHAALSTSRHIIALMRVMPLSEQSSNELAYIRQTLRPTLNLTEPPRERPYVEVHHLHWHSHNGNFLMVVPMGDEATHVYRHPDPSSLGEAGRPLHIEAEAGSFALTAPNGALLATLLFSGKQCEATLKRDEAVSIDLGRITLTLHPAALLPGGTPFVRPSVQCGCALVFGRRYRRNWPYAATATFDGTTLSVTVSQVSTGFRNANLAVPLDVLWTADTLSFVSPFRNVRLQVSAHAPVATASLDAEARLYARERSQP